MEQIDLIENCDVLSNVVVCDSILRHLNRVNIQAFHGLRNISELEDRRFYCYYNENSAETTSEHDLQESKGLGLDAKLTKKVFNVLKWYHKHF